MPPKSFTPKKGEWKRWCKKCENYKPERTHHCKACQTCVLKMDHHCPWTMNCVGAGNFSHFMRFLFWVLVATGNVLLKLGSRVVQYYEDSDLPAYLIDKKEMAAVIVLLPIDFFVFVSILILYGRCMANWIFKGMTQIEVWERDRIESQFYSERMWFRIRKNYYELHNKLMPELTSWNRTTRYYEDLAHEADELEDLSEPNDEQIQGIIDKKELTLVPKHFTMDDLIFPYDLGVWGNIVATCGYPWSWLLPWGRGTENGFQFTKSEDFEGDQLGLPWPIDGGHQEEELEVDEHIDDLINENNTVSAENVAMLKKKLEPRFTLDRSEWMNDVGEKLDDFGVDMDAEDPENDRLTT